MGKESAFTNVHESSTHSTILGAADSGAINGTEQLPATLIFLKKFDTNYAIVHGYLAAIISVAGVFANILTIIIMSRPDMRTPTNRLYAVMAFADLITMFLYSIFAIFLLIVFPESIAENQTKLRAIFLVFYADSSILVHTLSVSVLIAVTVFRVLILKLPQQASRLHCSLDRANLTAVIAAGFSVLLTIPNAYVTIWVERINDSNVTYWEVAHREAPVINSINFWLQAIFVKLLPCVLLTLASIIILRTLKEAERRRRRLQENKRQSRSSDPRIRNRTRMLLALLVVFLLTEFPQGILTLVCGIVQNPYVWQNVYMPLGNFLDMLTLINAGVNFVLFVSMSTEFRTALNKQLSSWFSCYAEIMAKKQERMMAARINGLTGNKSAPNTQTLQTTGGTDKQGAAAEELLSSQNDQLQEMDDDELVTDASAKRNTSVGTGAAVAMSDLEQAEVDDTELVIKSAKVNNKRISGGTPSQT